MNEYKNILTGDTARAWKRLRGRLYWLNDNEIAEHLIEVHEQWCREQCPLLKSCDQQKSGLETSCNQQKSGSERSCDRPDPSTQSTQTTQSNEENKNISLQLEVDEGAESVDDDSSNDGYHDPASEEEDDIKQEPEFMDCTPQNGDSTYQKGDEVFPLSTSKWTDSGGDHFKQSIPVVKQEPVDNDEFGNSVTQSVETTQTVSYHRTQLTSSGVTSHPIMSDTNVGVVKQEPTDKGEYENSVTKSVDISERIVKPLVPSGVPASPSVMSSNIVTSSGAPALQSVKSTNTIASVKASVIQGIPSTNTLGTGPQSMLKPVGTGPHSVLNPLGTGLQSVLNPLVSGPQSVFSIIPGVNVAQTPAVVNPAVIGAQTLLPVTPGIAQTINLTTSGNVVPPQLLNVVRRGNSLFLERASASPSAVPPNLQNPLFTVARQSDFNLLPTIPVAANVSNVGQGGSVPIQPMLVSSGQQVSTSFESPGVLDPITTPLKQETPSTNTPTGSLNRGASSKQTDEDWKQMDKKDEERLENSQIAGEVSSRTRRMKRRLFETEKGPSTSKRFVSETEGDETEVEENQPKDTYVSSTKRPWTYLDQELLGKGRLAVSASEKQRRYRQRRDQDPIRRAEYLTKERKKYQQMKECGKVKLIKDMSEGEQRCARKNWRNNKRDRRARQMLYSLTHPLAVVKRIQVHKQSEKREKEADSIEKKRVKGKLTCLVKD